MSSSDANGTSNASGAAAAIDDRRGADDLRARRPGHLHRLARRAAGRQHVLDDEHAIAVREHEAAAQRERAVLPLGEDRADAERAADFLADDDAAERRREHDRRAAGRACGPRWRGRAPRRDRDAAARARTAGSRGCAAPTTDGSGLRAARPSGETDRAVRRVSCVQRVVYRPLSCH